jgi:hypothetical protein
MAITDDTRAAALARGFSALLAGAEGVRGLWITTNRGAVTFWVLTDPLDLERHERIYERSASLYDQFPDALFDVHVLNPEWFEGGNALSALPPDARQIVLPEA